MRPGPLCGILKKIPAGPGPVKKESCPVKTFVKILVLLAALAALAAGLSLLAQEDRSRYVEIYDDSDEA